MRGVADIDPLLSEKVLSIELGVGSLVGLSYTLIYTVSGSKREVHLRYQGVVILRDWATGVAALFTQPGIETPSLLVTESTGSVIRIIDYSLGGHWVATFYLHCYNDSDDRSSS